MIHKMHTSLTPLEKAVFAVGGKQKTLAEKLGVTTQAITQLKKRGGTLPKGRMKDLVRVTGLTMEELYPEIFSH
ncbi:helix-turn-helix domain-containing protein [Atlantibacter subterranea]|uniref:Helix-turn-helix domain-containing protein n=2 Tax=Atlantibacter subterraneus TaxID=255519 RepID=A0A3R9EJJ0_9ENTR|nr:YdaS family helix-turn-helix protein [Atlantibacter subterranea]RSB59078.1 helix-turn-helix domain-containing protein [Atlantibacter subterranea]RSE03693.1 helix-turn-helix domain-containing protein [Atlantibacter subterranea]RSE24919.1 helix-turn-helix domain-containing protein [Atlantibacter subterranea]